MYVDFAGYLLFKDFCENVCDEPVPQLKFYEEVSVLNVECCVLVCVLGVRGGCVNSVGEMEIYRMHIRRYSALWYQYNFKVEHFN